MQVLRRPAIESTSAAPPRPTRILLVTPDFPPRSLGGGAVVAQHLAEEYVRRGRIVHVAALDTSRGGVNARPEHSSVGPYEVTFLPVAYHWSHKGISYDNAFPPSNSSIRWLVGGFRSRRWDTVHLHGVPVTMVDMVASLASLAGIPYVLTVHGVVQDRRRYGSLLGRAYATWEWAERLIYRRAAAITAVSEYTLNETERSGFTAPILRMIPNGSAPRVFTLSEERKRDILTKRGVQEGKFALDVGSLISRKGHDVFIDSVAGLARTDALPSDFRFVIAGRPLGGGNRKDLERRAMAGQVDGLFRILESVSEEEKEALYRGCAFVVCPTLYEASPVAIFDALAWGCAIIASDLPTLRGVLGEPPGPSLFSAGDAKALRTSMAKVLGDPAVLTRMREYSRDRSSQLPRWDQVAAMYLELLDRRSVAPGGREE